METPQAPQVPAQVPLMTKERFSHLTGLSVDTVEGQIRRGYLPTRKIGKRLLINLALLQAECLDEESWD